ncbi:retrovirus-related pol polyprotein from transposon TNT 1-94 [Tanacetum coccineum]
MWTKLCLAYEGPSDTRDTKIVALRLKFNAFKALEGDKVNGTYTRLKCLLNDLENNGVIISQSEVNATFVNSLPRKWLSMNQTSRANNSIKNDSLAALYGKYHYEEGLIDDIYANEFMVDLNAEYHERAQLENQKRFYKSSGRVGSARKPIDKSKETCFSCRKLGHFQKVCHSNKTSTPSYPSLNTSFNKPKPNTPSFTPNTSQNSSISQKDYKGKYKGLKAKIDVLSQRIDELTKGKYDKGKEDKGTTKFKAFMAIADDEPLVGKVIRVNLENESLKDEISYLKTVIEKWTCSKVTLDQLLSKQIPDNIVKALRRKGRRKENNSKEVLFTKADVSTSESALMITSDSEDDSDNQVPLPLLPKLTRAEPSGASKSIISLSDLTANMADLTLNIASKKIKKSSDKVSQTYVIKKKIEPKHPVIQISCPDKNALPSTKQLILTLMEEVKGIKNQILIPLDTSSSVSQASSSKTPRKKDYLKRSAWYLDSGCSRHMTGVKQYLHRYSKESSPKVVFRDNSSGDTEGYGSVCCNGITFTKVAYVNVPLSPSSFREKVSMLHATLKTDLLLCKDIGKQPLRCLEEEHGTSAILMFLAVMCTFTIIEITWENLMKRQMMDSFLVIPQWLKHSDFSTLGDKKWKKPFMYFPYVPAFDHLSTNNHVSSEPIITSSPLVSSTPEDSLIPNIEYVVPALDKAVYSDSAIVLESTDLQEDDKDETLIIDGQEKNILSWSTSLVNLWLILQPEAELEIQNLPQLKNAYMLTFSQRLNPKSSLKL